MNLLGIGIIFSGGRGIGRYEDTLKQGWQRPGECDIPRIQKRLPVFAVNDGDIADKVLLKKMRRADKFSKMAVVAASDAFHDSGVENSKNRTGIILATAFGAHQTTFDFLDNIIDYGETQVSPTIFSNSVHNAAVSYIASALDITGPTLTVTRFSFPFQSALQLAQLWLLDGRCDSVLVGVADQCGEVMRYIYDRKLGTAPDGKVRPFHFSPSSPPVPGEGSVFFLVSAKKPENAYCKIDGIDFSVEPGQEETSDIDLIDSDGTLEGAAYLKAFSPGTPVAAYSPLFGSIMTGSAFHCAAGALMLKKQTRYANPVPENPHGVYLLDMSGPARIDLIRSIGYNCSAESAVICLRKTGYYIT
jgi:3-oxoacyl-[acyl-carrier-protein] synthase II